jgi:hypothetical protein
MVEEEVVTPVTTLIFLLPITRSLKNQIREHYSGEFIILRREKTLLKIILNISRIQINNFLTISDSIRYIATRKIIT